MNPRLFCGSLLALRATVVALVSVMLITGCSSGSDGSSVLDDGSLASTDTGTGGGNPELESEIPVAEPLADDATEQTGELEEPSVVINEPAAGILEAPIETAESPTGIDDSPLEVVELSDPFSIVEATPALLRSVAGYQSDQLAPLVDVLAYEAIRGAFALGESLVDGAFSTQDSRFGTVVTPIERVRYNCAGGGTLVREIGRMRLVDISYSHNRNLDGYGFEQCRFRNEQTPLSSGDYVVTGHLVIDERFRSGSRFSESETSFAWDQFGLQGPDGVGYELNGFSSFSGSGGAFVDTFGNRIASFEVYRKSGGDGLEELITDSSFHQASVENQAGVQNSIEIELAGSITGATVEGSDVLIQTDTPLTHTAAPNFPDRYQPFVGQLALSSGDGSFLTLVADPSLNNFRPEDNLIMDWSGATADGTLISRDDVLLEEYRRVALNCNYSRAEDDVAYACTGEGEQFVVP